MRGYEVNHRGPAKGAAPAKEVTKSKATSKPKKKKPAAKKGKMPSELLERFKSKAVGAKGKEKPDKVGISYAGGSKTFNEKTGQHERPDGTPMKRKNIEMTRSRPDTPPSRMQKPKGKRLTGNSLKTKEQLEKKIERRTKAGKSTARVKAELKRRETTYDYQPSKGGATRTGAPSKGPEATPYRGDRPKDSGTIKKVVKESSNPYAGKGGGNGTYKKSDITKPKPAAKRTPAKRSEPKKAAAKRSTQKQSVAKKRRSSKK